MFILVPTFLTIFQATIYFITKLFSMDYYVLNNALDDLFPFVSEFIYLYVFWYILLFAVPYLYYKYDKEALKKYTYINFISVCICSIIFVLFPTTIIRPEINSSGITNSILNMIYSMDVPAVNCFPSIHCLICFIFILCNIKSKLPSIYKYLINILSVLIVLSTLLIKQHVIVDALGSLVISILVYIYVTKKETKLSFLSFLHKKL